VIVGRLVFHELNPIHSFYIKNLAAADLLVGIFLITVGFHDIKFRGRFLMFQHSWIHSSTCQLNGRYSGDKCKAIELWESNDDESQK